MTRWKSGIYSKSHCRTKKYFQNVWQLNETVTQIPRLPPTLWAAPDPKMKLLKVPDYGTMGATIYQKFLTLLCLSTLSANFPEMWKVHSFFTSLFRKCVLKAKNIPHWYLYQVSDTPSQVFSLVAALFLLYLPHVEHVEGTITFQF